MEVGGQFHAPATFITGGPWDPQYTLTRKLGGLQSQSGHI
jgi:hypothetical protein